MYIDDLMPTLTKMAGVELPQDNRFLDLGPVFLDARRPHRPVSYAAFMGAACDPIQGPQAEFKAAKPLASLHNA
ncbi:MAG: hypothetical protein AAF711_16840 [Planctomycetota bacterium]